MVATSSPLLLLVAATVLLVAPGANAHGVIHKPEMKFKGTEYAGGYSAEIAMETMPAVPPDVYAQNSWADIFGRAFKQSKYKSLREYMLKNQNTAKRVKNSNPMTPECGFTDPENQKPVAMPDKLEWYGGGMNHPGPCEAWCDNEIVLPFTVNCQATYPDGKFPYDKSKCVGKNRFSFYWMATLIGWQVYIDCATIGSGPVPPFDPSVTAGGSSSTGNSTTPAASPAPAPAPAATRATSKAPAPAPAPAPAKAPATAPTTGGEASAGAKCKRRD